MPYDSASGFPFPKTGGEATPGNPQAAANARAPDFSSPTWGQRLLGRVVAYAMRGVDSPSAFFSPQQPLLPVAQPPDTGALGRTFDYPSGYNTRTTPRLEEPTSFGTLKALADGYDVLRTIIETRKDQIASMQWTIGTKDKSKKPDTRADLLTEFWQSPDKEHSWHDWLRMLMEQLFVIDAPALYCRMTRGGELYALEVLDGANFARKLTLDGRTPDAFEGPAYQQVLKGLPAVDYVKPLPKGIRPPTDQNGMPMPELIYRPRNLRVDRVYGFSPVEQIITTVNIALRREIYLLNYYTEGSQSDLLFGVPDNWNPNQIAQFQTNWNAMLEGNLIQRRKAQFIPGGVKPFDVREKALTDQSDEWLTRICCFAFSISPNAFVRQMNRATADNAKETAIEEGLGPIKLWIADLVAYVHRVKFGIDDLVLKWEETEEVSPLDQKDIDIALVGAKIYHPDEIRAKRGDDAMPDELRAQMDIATFSAAANSTILPEDQQAVKDAAAKELAAAKPAPVMGPPGAGAPGGGGSPREPARKYSDDQPRDYHGRWSAGDSAHFSGQSPDAKVTGDATVTIISPHSNASLVTHTDKRGRQYEGANVHIPQATVELDRSKRGLPALRFQAHHHQLSPPGGRKFAEGDEDFAYAGPPFVFNVNMPEIRSPDVFVDVGATTVQAKFEQSAYERDANGNFIAKVTGPARPISKAR